MTRSLLNTPMIGVSTQRRGFTPDPDQEALPPGSTAKGSGPWNRLTIGLQRPGLCWRVQGGKASLALRSPDAPEYWERGRNHILDISAERHRLLHAAQRQERNGFKKPFLDPFRNRL